MPTPTPIPSSQIIQAIDAVHNTVNDATQQGIVSFVVIMAFAVLVFAIAYALSVVFNRNRKPDNTATNSLIESQSETLKELREEFKQERIEWRKLIDKQGDNFTEAVQHLGDGYNRSVDVQEKQVALETSINSERRSDSAIISALRADVGQMVSEGSIPLRNLIIETHTVKSDTEFILEHVKKIEEWLQRQADCAGIAESFEAFKKEMREQAKRDTSTNPVTVNVNPPPAVLIPDTDANGAASVPAAA